MSEVAVIGERTRIQGFALAGARTHAADTAEQVRDAWANLSPDVAVVVLTKAAAAVLRDQLDDPASPVLPVVMPA